MTEPQQAFALTVQIGGETRQDLLAWQDVLVELEGIELEQVAEHLLGQVFERSASSSAGA
ncbi:MAG TPA: hypothetical protein VMP01_08205 [Pirellulaceae bacterium]|nr:hypothetical protein [Pirellulaceae bacterium]